MMFLGGSEMRIALAQLNPTVGDIEGNAARIADQVAAAKAAGAHLAVFPAMALFGYPPKDLLLREALVERCRKALDGLAGKCGGIVAVVGTVMWNPTGRGHMLRNIAAVLRDGRVDKVYAKRLLPAYDVFDETRYFAPGTSTLVVRVAGRAVGITICEDMWRDELPQRGYRDDPVDDTVQAGADMVANISASPFSVGKLEAREAMMQSHAERHQAPLVYVNQVGGNDDLLFDGASAIISCDGVEARAKAFEEDLLVYDMGDAGPNRLCMASDPNPREERYPERIESVRRAIVMGTRDYLAKCGFSEAVIGLSGGIDSAVTAAIAVEALGAENVHGVAMPSRHSSRHSMKDAQRLAKNLGVDFRTIPIEQAHAAFEAMMAPSFKGRREDATEENIQARVRGNILMALSNKFGWLVLTTGNKSELAVGYCTLYGDMSGGLAVISDLPKTLVFELAEHINAVAGSSVIPRNTIDKPPSAELREGQLDQDALPPYPLLDWILEMHVEKCMPADQIAAGLRESSLVPDKGRTADEWVGLVVGMVDRNEYKRNQAAPGLRVTSRAFGSGWRLPLAAKL